MRRRGGSLTKRGGAVLAIVGLGVCLATPAGGSVERVVDVLDQRHGMPTPGVSTLAQDKAGFLWIGTGAGVVRYDGRHLRPWGGPPMHPRIDRIVASTDGAVIVRDSLGGLYRVNREGVAAVAGPDGNPLADVADADFDGASHLFVLHERRLLSLDPGGTWREVRAGLAEGERGSYVRGGRDGRMYLLTTRGVRRIDGDGSTLVMEVPGGAHRVFVTAAGKVFASPFGAQVLESSAAGPIERLRVAGRIVDLIERGSTIWVSIDRYLAVLREGEPPELLGARDGVPNGGPLLIDREGVLWHGTSAGLMRYSEPDTLLWTEATGLPSSHARWVARTAEGIWVATWQGVGRILPHGEPPGATAEPGIGMGSPCVDARGRLWIGERGGVSVREGGRFRRYFDPIGHGTTGCAAASDGGVWLPTARGVFFTAPEGGAPRRIASGPPGHDEGRWWNEVLEDREGRLWLTSGETVCHAPAAQVRTGAAVEWSCREVPGTYLIKDLIEVDSGALWIASERGGVHRGGVDGWEQIPAVRALASPWVEGLSPSPSGGIWVAAHAGVFRVRERADVAPGWEVVERLGRWHGLRQTWAEDVLEDPGGSLWLSNWSGVSRIPSAARGRGDGPPPLALVDLATDDQDLTGREEIVLPHRQNRIAIGFAALSFRDPGLLRYQYRTRGEGDWQEASDPSLRLVELAAGRHLVEMRASLDGARWTDPPLRVDLRVLRPWYLQAWAVGLWVTLVGMALYAAHRLRLGVLMRLERQRAAIAMDLHDEMGSGLGSIGLLAGLAAEGETREEERQALARRIARDAEALSASLGDIVWSLRREAGDLAGLATQIAERGGGMTGPGMRFEVVFPDPWPRVPLSLAARRAVQRIAVEAMHNVMQHARATRMTLGFAPDGARWLLWVEDDGRGLPPGAEQGDGLGLKSMRARAGELGAELSWSRPPGGGTRLELRFHPEKGPGRALA